MAKNIFNLGENADQEAGDSEYQKRNVKISDNLEGGIDQTDDSGHPINYLVPQNSMSMVDKKSDASSESLEIIKPGDIQEAQQKAPSSSNHSRNKEKKNRRETSSFPALVNR